MVLLWPTAAHATPFATYSYSLGVLGNDNGTNCVAQGVPNTTASVTSGTALTKIVSVSPSQAGVTIDPFAASVYAQASATGGVTARYCNYPSGNSDANLNYSFSVVSPAGSAIKYVPVIATGLFTLDQGGDSSQATVNIDLRGANADAKGDQNIEFGCYTYPGGASTYSCGTHNYQLSVAVPTLAVSNTEYSGEINIDASAAFNSTPYSCGSESATGECTRPESGSAYVDPYIEIDPAFLASHPGFSLVVSDNIGNSPSVPAAAPEPGTFALSGAALMLGVSLVRSRCRPR